MELELWQFGVVFLLIGLAGFIDSIAGGGGLITVPTYLALGLPAEMILGTNKCVSTIGTSFAVFRYIRNRTILWNTAIYAIVAALIGSAIGASFSDYLSRHIIFIMLLVLSPVLVYLQAKHMRIHVKTELTQHQVVVRASMAGLLIGGYDGFFGPGTGTFLLLAFLVFLQMSSREASANARIVNYASNISAFIYFLAHGRIYAPVAFVAILGSICGNWLGSGMVINNADRVVVPMFRLVLVLLMFKCGYDLFFA